MPFRSAGYWILESFSWQFLANAFAFFRPQERFLREVSCRRKNLSPRATPTPAPRRSQRPSRRAAAALRRQRPHGPQAVSVPLRAPRHRPRHIVDRTPDQRVPQHLDPAPFPASASVHCADPSPAPLGGCVCVRGSFALLSRPDSCAAPGSKVKGDPRPPCALALLVEVARDGHLAVLLLHPQTA